MDVTFASSLPRSSDVSHMLSLHKILFHASSIPCSSGLAAFQSFLPSESQRFRLALGVLLPALQDLNVQPPQKILAAYVLHGLYAPREDLNPFYDHLLRVFELERATAISRLRNIQLRGSPVPKSPEEGTAALQPVNEQFIWVLWKILKGEGEDLSQYSPDILSRVVLPQHLHAAHLVLQNGKNDPNSIPAVNGFPPSRDSSATQQLSCALFQNHLRHMEQETNLSSPLPPTDPFKQYVSSELNQTQVTSSFSPFTSPPEPENSPGTAPLRAGKIPSGWRREQTLNHSHQNTQQMQSELLRQLETHSMRSQSNTTPIREVSAPAPTIANKDDRREALLHALCVEPPPESHFQPRGRADALTQAWSGHAESNNSSNTTFDQGAVDRSKFDVTYGYELRHGMRASPIQQWPPQHPVIFPHLTSTRVPLQFPKAQNKESTSSERQTDISTSLADSVSHAIPQSQFGPIARPRPTPSPFRNEMRDVSAPGPSNAADPWYTPVETPSQVARLSAAHGALQQTHGSVQNGYLREILTPSPSTAVNPFGAIGSGRPSKPQGPVGSDVGERGRPPSFGVIGNGRPPRSSPLGTRNIDENPYGVPFSIRPMEERREEAGKMDLGAIRRPNGSTREGDELPVRDAGGSSEKTQEKEDSGVNAPTSARSPSLGRTWDSSLKGNPRQSVICSSSLEVTLAQTLSESRVLRASKASAITSPTEISISPNTQNSTLSSSPDHPSPTSTDPAVFSEISQLQKEFENLRLSPARAADIDIKPRPEVGDKERDELSRAIILLLSARERVLTLSEQRFLTPHLSILTSPFSLLRPGDIHSLIAKNPDVAAKLLVLLLDRDDDDGARIEGVLHDVRRNDLFHIEPAREHFDTTLPASADATDAIENAIQFVAGVGSSSSESGKLDKVSPFGGREAREGYLEALRRLPPTMQSFNLIAKLLRPTPQGIAVQPLHDEDAPELRVAKLIRTDVLGGFLSGCVGWIEEAQETERVGEVPDDRVASSVSSLSRFYTSLLKHGFVSTESEVDTAEIMSFALQFSRFEEARSLYSTLAIGRT